MNVNDLDESVPGSVIPDTWKNKTAGQIQEQLRNSHLHDSLVKDGHLAKIESWLNWKNWTIDQLQTQLNLDKGKAVRQKLRAQFPDAVKKLEILIGPGGPLEELTESSSSNWDIRKLKIPAQLAVTSVGKQTRGYKTYAPDDENHYSITLNDLKESVTLYVQAEDFYPAPKEIQAGPAAAVYPAGSRNRRAGVQVFPAPGQPGAAQGRAAFKEHPGTVADRPEQSVRGAVRVQRQVDRDLGAGTETRRFHPPAARALRRKMAKCPRLPSPSPRTANRSR